jgi:hypothetical protein
MDKECPMFILRTANNIFERMSGFNILVSPTMGVLTKDYEVSPANAFDFALMKGRIIDQCLKFRPDMEKEKLLSVKSYNQYFMILKGVALYIFGNKAQDVITRIEELIKKSYFKLKGIPVVDLIQGTWDESD